MSESCLKAVVFLEMRLFLGNRGVDYKRFTTQMYSPNQRPYKDGCPFVQDCMWNIMFVSGRVSVFGVCFGSGLRLLAFRPVQLEYVFGLVRAGTSASLGTSGSWLGHSGTLCFLQY